MQRRHWLTAVMILFAALISAAYNITGTVIDTNGEALPDATVRLLSSRDSSYVKGGAADVDGKFNLSGVKSGKYILECNYMGYKPSFVDIEIKKRHLTQVRSPFRRHHSC